MKKLLLAGLGFTAWAGMAAAADLPAKAPPALYAPPYSWTGCYGGGNFGSIFTNDGWSGGTAATGFTSAAYTATDLIIGGQAGCNYQFGSWVLGVQGEYDWSQANGTGADILNANGLTDETKTTSLSSVTGRLGYAFDRWLPYVKGGGAWARDDYSTVIAATNAPFALLNTTRSGWTVGGGIEYAIVSNLSMFVEYDWYDFGTTTNTFTGVAGAVFPVTSIHERDSVFKVGLNWKVWPW